MNLNQLKMFYLSAKYGRISQAAKELSVSQPAVSKAVRKLEADHSLVLFERRGRSLALTEAGKAIYVYAERIFELESLASECLDSFNGSSSRHIKIDSGEIFGVYCLPRIVNRFCKAHKDIQVCVYTMFSEDVIQSTLDLKNDFGVAPTRPPESLKLKTWLVIDDKLEFIASPGHPLAGCKGEIAPAKLNGLPVIMSERGSAPRVLLDDFLESRRIRVNSPMELSSTEAVKNAVLSGLGISLVSELAVKREILAGSLVRLRVAGAPLARRMYVITHKEKHVTPAMLAFFELIERMGRGRRP